MQQDNIKPVNINGTDYLTIGQFALLTNKSESTIRYLTLKGNVIRKLATVKYGSKPFIPFSELTEFPFVKNGRPNEFGFLVVKYKMYKDKLIPEETFHYNEKIVEGADE